MPDISWLKSAVLHANKPKHSIISMLKEQLGGNHPARPISVLHASDVTQDGFCARQWALFDILDKKPDSKFVSTALATTFSLGHEVERLVVEEWAGAHAIGNWQCRYCKCHRVMTSKPGGYCPDSLGQQKHGWQYQQFVVDEAEKYGLSGAIDCLFDVGAPKILVTEIKILNTKEFEDIQVPLVEHRLRTALYLKLIASSDSPYKDLINLHEARVLYVSRGYGKMNAEWNEILPFKEYPVKRDDESIKDILQKATLLNDFRTQKILPCGICSTATDLPAKKCKVVKECFSGNYPAGTEYVTNHDQT